MAADLRERVARALSRRRFKDESVWQGYLPHADAVLAELGLTQAEPVAFRKPETREELLILARHARAHLAFINKLLDEAFAEAAPQPQPQASAEDVALVGAWMEFSHDPKKHEAWQRIRASLGVVK